MLSKDKFQIPVLLKAYFRHGFDILEALVAAGTVEGDMMERRDGGTPPHIHRATPQHDKTGGLTVATKFEPRDRHTLACFAARDGRTELLARLHRQVRPSAEDPRRARHCVVLLV